jgi:hypothetical protein
MAFYYELHKLDKTFTATHAQRTAEGLLRLKEAFKTDGVPERRRASRLLLATWNIREFGVYAPDIPKTTAGAPGKFKDWRTYQMSDHLPMWIELRVDFSPEYLKRIAEGKSAEVPVSAPVKS